MSTTPEDSRRAPYAEALLAHAARRPLSYMVPGHGGVAGGMAAGQAELLGQQVLHVDIATLTDGIDVGDDSPRARALQLAAEAWGARRSWFLTNGSSQGNRLAALAVRQLGSDIVVQRSAHSSMVDGLIVAGLRPSYVDPSIDHENGIAHGVTPEDVARSIASHPGPVTAVYIVSPSYFGAVADIPSIARVTHDAGAVLVVDCAWGAHFGFHPALPPSPVQQGADIVVMSTHKMASSLFQSAVLHLGHTEYADVLEPALERAYRMTASTSESALLLGSIDVSRRDLQHSSNLIDEELHTLGLARERIRNEANISLIEDTFSLYPDIVDRDPLRLPIDISRLREDGRALRLSLGREDNIWVEMATETTIVPLLGIGSRTSFDPLLRALAGRACADTTERRESMILRLPPPAPVEVTPREAFFSATEVVTFENAVGRVSADSLAAYPPGIPNVLPGERLTKEAVLFLREVAASPGGYVRGAVRSDMSRFRVIVKRVSRAVTSVK